MGGQAGACAPEPTAESPLPPRPDGWALFLDIDGTLLDLALTPDRVAVPDGLARGLVALHRRFGGAMALVTGRSIAMVDMLFAPAVLPVAGLHGAEIRFADGRLRPPPPVPALALLRAPLAAYVARRPGLLLEDKGHALAVHYRLVPELAPEVEAEMRALVERAGEGLGVQSGKMVVEIRPAGANKGRAVEAYLGEADFAGRRPLALGDDLTDEAMFAAVNAAGGVSVRVGPPAGQTLARFALASSAAVRSWLAALVDAPRVGTMT